MADKDAITSEVKAIIDKFMQALATAEGMQDEFGAEREHCLRTPHGHEKDPCFRERMFKNAPKKNDEFLIAEKKHW